MTRILTFISIALSAGVLAFGIALNGHILASVIIAILGIGWLVLHLRGINRFSGLMFAVFVLISLICVWLEIPPSFALAGITLSLTAWDLTTFGQRLAMTDSPSDARRSENAHLLRLFLVLGLGVSGYIAATLFEVNLTFGAAALLALLGIWGISALVYRLRSSE
jgi:hypothetical protein